jgi:SAM-dependent methyltransferase
MSDSLSGIQAWIPRLISLVRAASLSPSGKLTLSEIQEVGKAVRELSSGLTGGRKLAGALYLDAKRFLDAYLLFYWPVSYAQCSWILEDLALRGIRPVRGASALDLGCGPGPLSCALSDAGFGTVIACDESKKALDTFGTLARGHVTCRTLPWDARSLVLPPGAAGKFGCVSFGHVLNELFPGDEDRLEKRARLVEAAAGRLVDDGFVLIIEPALLGTSRDLLALRDLLVSRGYPVFSPCLYRFPCPALLKEDGTCHASSRWELPVMVRDLAKAAGIHKDELKMTCLVLGKKGAQWPGKALANGEAHSGLPREQDGTGTQRVLPPGRMFRVVSDPMLNKAGKTRYMICGEEGRFTLMAKAGSGFRAEKAFFALSRGDLFVLSGPTEKRETGESITADTVISPASSVSCQ